jgi:beta-lactamase class A
LVAAFVLLTAPVVADDGFSADFIETTVTYHERLLDARIGVAVADTETGSSWQYRGNERFPLTSTFKPLACAALLANVDAGIDELNRSVVVHPDQIVPYSPVTQAFTGSEITLRLACEAAITVSDNTAGNLLLAAIGGPPGLTAFLQRIGDNYTRLDRIEPFLNEASPGDPRDTTTPDAMVKTLMVLLSGGSLSEASARLLENWLVADRVADALFRSRLPAGWRIGDKTGAGGNGSRALIAVLRPPGRKAAFAAVYITQTDAEFAARNEAIAEIGAAIFAVLMQQKTTPH